MPANLGALCVAQRIFLNIAFHVKTCKGRQTQTSLSTHRHRLHDLKLCQDILCSSVLNLA